MVLDNVTDATVQPLIVKVAEFCDRLGTIEEAVAQAEKSGPSKKEVLERWEELFPNQYGTYLALLEQARQAYKEFFHAEYGVEDTETDGLIFEAKEIHLQNLRLLKTLEETFGMTGIVNAVYNVIPKPEGAGIRSQYKGYGGYVEKK